MLYWTGGQPYLTQRLCRALADDPQAASPAHVDQLCDALFLSRTAREADDNLAFVRNRLLRGDVDLASLLDLYRKVRQGKPIKDDETNPLATALRLSGVARAVNGTLHVRNRIYDRVFDRDWILTHMPGAELRRQRAAYRRGVLRTAAVATLIVGVITGLAVTAVRSEARARRLAGQRLQALGEVQATLTRALRAEQQERELRLAAQRSQGQADASARQAQRSAVAEREAARQAREEQQRAEQAALSEAAQRRRAENEQHRAQIAAGEARSAAGVAREQRTRAEEGEQAAQRALYGVQMNLAQRAWEDGNVQRGLLLLDAQRPAPGKEDRRGFEWRYLWRLCQGEARLSWDVPALDGLIFTWLVTPDGQTLVSGATDGTLQFWDIPNRRRAASVPAHKAAITFSALSPDGRTLATASADHSVKLWDVTTHRELARLEGHAESVAGVAFSGDGQTLASASDDRTVRLWQVKIGQPLATIPAAAPLAEVAISPDGQAVAAASRANPKGTVWLWQRGSGSAFREVATLKDNTGPLRFSPDGKTLASTSGNSVRLWDAASGQAVASLPGHTLPIITVVFSPDGQTLASGSQDNTIRLWKPGAPTTAAGDSAQGRNWPSWRGVAVLAGHSDLVWRLVFSPDGQTLASASADTTIKLWDVATAHELTTLRGHPNGLFAIALSGDGKTLTTVSFGQNQNPRLNQWDVGGQGETATELRSPAAVNTVAFSLDGKLLASGSADGSVELWDRESGQLRKRLPGAMTAVEALAFSPDGRTLAAAGAADQTHAVWLWDVESGALRAAQNGTVHALAFSPDGQSLAAGGDGSVRLCDGHTGQQRAILWGSPGPVSSLAFSPDGQSLVVTTGTSNTTIWHVATRWPVTTLRAIGGRAIFFRDGRRLLLSDNGTTKVWDLAEGRAVAWLEQPAAGAALGMSPDGQTVAVGSGNNVLLWNLASRQQVAALKGHSGAVRVVEFSPDGSTLASGSVDGTVRLWHAASVQKTDPLQIVASSGDRRVRLQWRRLPHVRGYHVYRVVQASRAAHPGFPLAGAGTRPLRGYPSRAAHLQAGTRPLLGYPRERPQGLTPTVSAAAESPARLVRLSAHPLTEPLFEDHSAGLANGRPQKYAVSALFEAPGKLAEGEPVRLAATPMAAPPGWFGTSINETAQPASTTARSGSVQFGARAGAIILRGSGHDLWDAADEGYFLNRAVSGDFQLTATLLAGPTNSNEWAKAGLMIREALDPGARDAFLVATPMHGVAFQWRGVTNRAPFDPVPNGSTTVLQPAELRRPLVLRLTRRGSAIQAEISRDGGRSFEPNGEPLQFAQPLPPMLYVGLVATAHDPARITEAHFRDLLVRPLPPEALIPHAQPGRAAPPPFLTVDPLQVSASTGDRMVQLAWQPLAGAIGYQVYRGPVGAPRTQMTRLTARPILHTMLIDRSPGLHNGRAVAYEVAPVLRERSGQARELTPVRLQVTPGALTLMPGFVGSSMDEGAIKGRIQFQPRTGQIILSGAGLQLAGGSDSLYFVHRPISGHFQVQVRLLAGPTPTAGFSKAGLMIREALDPGARRVALFATSAPDLRFQWRSTEEGDTDVRVAMPSGGFKPPILLRLTRRGDTIQTDYSHDEGRSFQPVGEPWHANSPLPETLSVGLTIASEDDSQATEARFSSLEIRRLAPSGR